MNFISKMPNGLTYSVSKENGREVATLDMTRTAINMVPPKLAGVDCVVVNAGQLCYVAPDYRGKVTVVHEVISGGAIGKVKEPMARKDVVELKKNYQQALAYSPIYFDVSSVNAYGQEQNLPAGLTFDKHYRVLNLSKTVLTVMPRVLGTNARVMPDRLLQHNLDELRHKNNEIRAKAAKKDFGYVRSVCCFSRSKSLSHADRLVK